MEAIDYIRAMMWIIGGATTLICIVVGGILAYHWRYYSQDTHTGKFAMIIYAAVSVFLALIMFAMTPAF